MSEPKGRGAGRHPRDLGLAEARALVQRAVDTILKTAKTGKIGDGKIFLTRVDEAIRIRNEERGENAL